MPKPKEILQNINRAKTVKELLAAIPQPLIGTISTVLLCYFCVVPLLASLTFNGGDYYFFDSDISFLLSSTFPYGDHWYRLESTVIILSFLFVAYSAAGLYYHLRDSRRTLGSWLAGHRAVLFFGLLFLWAVVSFALSSHPFRSFFGTGYRHDGLLTYAFYIGLFCMALQLDRRQMRTVLEVFAAVGAVLGLICVFPNSALAQLFYLREEGFKLSIFLQRTHYGYYLSMCLPAGLLLLLTDDFAQHSKWGRAVLRAARLAECWLLVNSLVFNATRATIVAVAVFLLAVHAHTLLFHRRSAGPLLCADALILATVTCLNTGNNLLVRTAASSDYAQELRTAFKENQQSVPSAASVADAANRLTSSRYDMWSCGIKYALQRPVFGWGPDNLGELYYADGLAYTDRPHNELIQIAAMLGFPALAFYLCGLCSWLRPILKQSRRLDLFDFGLAMVAVSYLVNSVFSNSMFYTTPYFFVFMGFAYKRERAAG